MTDRLVIINSWYGFADNETADGGKKGYSYRDVSELQPLFDQGYHVVSYQLVQASGTSMVQIAIHLRK